MADAAVDTDRTITITDRAHEQIMGLRAAEDDGDNLALRIEVTGVRGADFTYDLAFEPLTEAPADDSRYDDRGLVVLIPPESIDKLRGATLDLPSSGAQGGLVLRNGMSLDDVAVTPVAAGTGAGAG